MDSNASFAGEVERNVSRDNDFSLLCKLHQTRLVRMHPLAAIAHVILESRGAARRSESEEPGRGRSPPGPPFGSNANGNNLEAGREYAGVWLLEP